MKAGSASRAARRAGLTVLVVALAGLLCLLPTPAATSAFTSTVRSPTSTTLLTTDTAFTCRQAATAGTSGVAAQVTYPLDETSGPTANDVATSSGSPRPGTYSAAGITYGAPGPCPRDAGRAVTLDGSQGSVTGPASALPAATTWTQEVWFRGTSKAGDLLAFASTATGGAGTAVDRRVYLTSSGQLVAAVLAGGTTPSAVTTARTWTDDVWHDVVVTQAGAASAVPGLRLYVDGVLRASDTSLTSTAGLSQYWRIGGSGHDPAAARWPGETTTASLAGSLAWASYGATALTAHDVAAHYAAGRQPPPRSGRWSFAMATVGDDRRLLRHWGFYLYTDDIYSWDWVGMNDTTFNLEPGRADPSCVSFRSVNYPDRLIHHDSGLRLIIEAPDGTHAWDETATFCPQPGHDGEGISWSCYDMPTRFWRVYGTTLFVAADNGPNWWETDTNWADETSWNTRLPQVP